MSRLKYKHGALMVLLWLLSFFPVAAVFHFGVASAFSAMVAELVGAPSFVVFWVVL